MIAVAAVWEQNRSFLHLIVSKRLSAVSQNNRANRQLRRAFLITLISQSLGSPGNFDARPAPVSEQQKPDSAPITFGDNFESPAAPDGIVIAIANTWEVKVGASGDTFTPNVVNITIGDTVHWTWVGIGHTVTSGSPCTINSNFCSPSDTNCTTPTTSNPPSTYSHTFNQVGTVPYFCAIHCFFGMTGTINVAPAISALSFDANGFGMTGRTTPSTSVTIESTSSLATAFQHPTSVAANSVGRFFFTDPNTPQSGATFYRVTVP